VFLAGVLSGGVYHVIHTWPKFRGEKGSETPAAVSEGWTGEGHKRGLRCISAVL